MDSLFKQTVHWIQETKDECLEPMASFFDRRIDDYEAHMAQWSDHYKWMAELLPPSIHSLLDIGCGSGLELGPIFSRFPNLQVTGIDLSRQMLERLFNAYAGRALTLIHGDYFLWDMGNSCFDAVVSFETLHHFTPSKKQILFERVFRCLKPGGVYLECDYIAPSQEYEDLLFTECARRRQRDNIPEDVFVHFDTPLTVEHELAVIKAAGFSTVQLVGFLPGDSHTAMIQAIR